MPKMISLLSSRFVLCLESEVLIPIIGFIATRPQVWSWNASVLPCSAYLLAQGCRSGNALRRERHTTDGEEKAIRHDTGVHHMEMTADDRCLLHISWSTVLQDVPWAVRPDSYETCPAPRAKECTSCALLLLMLTGIRYCIFMYFLFMISISDSA